MSKPPSPENLVTLDASQPVWDRCFMVAPLVLVGTRDADGSLDLAPKHMAFLILPSAHPMEVFCANDTTGWYLNVGG